MPNLKRLIFNEQNQLFDEEGPLFTFGSKDAFIKHTSPHLSKNRPLSPVNAQPIGEPALLTFDAGCSDFNKDFISTLETKAQELGANAYMVGTNPHRHSPALSYYPVQFYKISHPHKTRGGPVDGQAGEAD